MPDNNKKVTVTQLNTVITAFASKSDTRFAKDADLTDLTTRVGTAESTLDGGITASNLSTTLANTINGKANTSDLGDVAALDSIAEANLGTDLANKINGKADTSSLGSLAAKSTVGTSDLDSALASTINGKADAANIGDVAALDEIAEANLDSTLASKINGKADTSSLGALASKSTVASGDLDAALAATITAKANADDVYTKAQTDTAIATAVSAAEHLKRKVVANKAAMDAYLADSTKSDRDQYIYCVPNTDSTDPATYDEYLAIYDETAGEYVANKVGDWKVDLSGYATTADVETASSAEIQAIVDGIWPANNSGE